MWRFDRRPATAANESGGDYAIWLVKHERAANATSAAQSLDQRTLTPRGMGLISPFMQRLFQTIAVAGRRRRRTTARMRVRA
jgi:hypothetical protein